MAVEAHPPGREVGPCQCTVTGAVPWRTVEGQSTRQRPLYDADGEVRGDGDAHRLGGPTG